MGEVLNLQLPEPHEGQKAVLRSKARFKVLMCGRRWGKSLISQVIAIVCGLKNRRIAYITPEFSLAKEFFKELMEMLPDGVIESSNKSELKIEFVTGGTIRFFSGEALRSMRGLKFHTVIIDEAAFIPDLEHEWKTAIRPTLTDYKGNALFISTPRGRNFFYTLFLRGQNKENGYESFHYSSYDNPHVANSEIDEAKAEIPEEAFKQEYLAIASANAGAVVSMDVISRNTEIELSTEPTVAYGIDVAKYTDFTVITGLDKFGKMSHFDRFQKDNALTKSAILALPSNVPKLMDSTHGSLGDGILEDLTLLNCENLIGFEFTAVSKPQLITELILSVEKDELKFNEITAKEFSIFEYTYSSTGHIKYGNSPGGHDDCVIALALAKRCKRLYHYDVIEDGFEIPD